MANLGNMRPAVEKANALHNAFKSARLRYLHNKTEAKDQNCNFFNAVFALASFSNAERQDRSISRELPATLCTSNAKGVTQVLRTSPIPLTICACIYFCSASSKQGQMPIRNV